MKRRRTHFKRAKDDLSPPRPRNFEKPGLSISQNIRKMNVDMEKKKSMMVASIEEGKEQRLFKENFDPEPKCFIYRVPKDLHIINEEAYTPKVISIGPLHHGKKELDNMEEQKIKFNREFSKRITSKTWQGFINFLEKYEQRIRNCYEETSMLQSLQFISMILYDAVFIIELFLKDYFKEESDLSRNKPRIKSAIWLDLQLLENQLPYFVLKELYMLAFPNSMDPNEQRYPSFFSLSCAFLYDSMFVGIPVEEGIKHFTDLRRCVMTKMYPKSESREMLIELPCASKLQESGIKFNRIEGDSLLDIRYEKKRQNITCFEVHELRLSRIQVYHETECLVRNVMALERCHYPGDTLVCSYIFFMDALIKTEEDANLLAEAGVISNHLGDIAKIPQMFGNLRRQINLSHFHFYDIVKDLNAHHDNRWNRAKAKVKRVFFGNFWSRTKSVTAIMIILLILIQIMRSILRVV